MEEQKNKKRKNALSYFVGIILLFLLVGIIRSDSKNIFGIDEDIVAEKVRTSFGKVSGAFGTFSSFTSSGSPTVGLFNNLLGTWGAGGGTNGAKDLFQVPESFVPSVPDFDNGNEVETLEN
jgi:hypothetical protein